MGRSKLWFSGIPKSVVNLQRKAETHTHWQSGDWVRPEVGGTMDGGQTMPAMLCSDLSGGVVTQVFILQLIKLSSSMSCAPGRRSMGDIKTESSPWGQGWGSLGLCSHHPQWTTNRPASWSLVLYSPLSSLTRGVKRSFHGTRMPWGACTQSQCLSSHNTTCCNPVQINRQLQIMKQHSVLLTGLCGWRQKKNVLTTNV
jgi:hypothetical protein